MDKQEPAAWMWDVYSGAGYTSRGIDFYPTNIPFAKHTPLYTAPPKKEWVGMTEDEISQMEKDYLWGGKEFNAELGYWAVYRAIEAKLKEKNNAA